MNQLYCMNCYGPKPVSRLGDYHCEVCATAGREAEEYARKEGKDPGTERRKALLQRSPSSMAHKHPSMVFERVNTEALRRREAIEPGSPEDPRRSPRIRRP